MATRATLATLAIDLQPTGNTQGGHYFFSLTTQRRLIRSDWNKLPIPAEVISRVHEMASRNVGTQEGLIFFMKKLD